MAKKHTFILPWWEKRKKNKFWHSFHCSENVLNTFSSFVGLRLLVSLLENAQDAYIFDLWKIGFPFGLSKQFGDSYISVWRPESLHLTRGILDFLILSCITLATTVKQGDGLKVPTLDWTAPILIIFILYVCECLGLAGKKMIWMKIQSM